jgi:putative FmdB family regulatory protein
MPIYEYRCGECGFQKEFLQRMSDAPLKDCPACGKPALVKMVSAAGFQLKGTGWYATDFKHGSAKPAAKAGTSAGTSAGNTADKPAETAKSTEASTSASTATKETPKSDAPGSTGASTPAS